MNISRTKRAFEVKKKTCFLVSKVPSFRLWRLNNKNVFNMILKHMLMYMEIILQKFHFHIFNIFREAGLSISFKDFYTYMIAFSGQTCRSVCKRPSSNIFLTGNCWKSHYCYLKFRCIPIFRKILFCFLIDIRRI